MADPECKELESASPEDGSDGGLATICDSDDVTTQVLSVVALLGDLQDLLAELRSGTVPGDAQFRHAEWKRIATVFEARLGEVSDRATRLGLLRALLSIYEGPLPTPDLAFDRATEILELCPGDRTAYAAMERVDWEHGRYDRLVDTLIARSKECEQDERLWLHVRIARLAEECLKTPDLACEHYRDALNLRPGNEAILQALEDVLKRSGRDQAFAGVLQEQADAVDDPVQALTFLRTAAQRLSSCGNWVAAQDAWERVLEEDVDLASLEALIDVLERRGHVPEALAARLQQLSELVREDDPSRSYDLLRRRAAVQWEAGDDAGARETLRLATSQCKEVDDVPRLAELLVYRIELWPLEEEALSLAREVYALKGRPEVLPEILVKALKFWSTAEPSDIEPHEALLPLLERLGDHAGVVQTLDALAALSRDQEQAAAFTLRAAEIAYHKLGDIDGAWTRVFPLFRDGHAAARPVLAELADAGERNGDLAALYVRLARDEENASAALGLWRKAARRYEKAGLPALALEACLRALAKDLSRRDLLEYAERLADDAQAWARLGAVYERLVLTSEDAVTKSQLLTRHAAVLEERMGERKAALERVCQALQLVPDSDLLLAHAERLARLTPSPERMCEIYMRRARALTDPEERIRALLAAAEAAVLVARDDGRAVECLTGAIVTGAYKDHALAEIEARIFDVQELAPDELNQLRAPWRVALEAASQSTDPKTASRLLKRAASVHCEGSEKQSSAYALLQRALELTPRDESLLEAMVQAALRDGLRAELIAYLGRFAAATLYSDAECGALRRLAALLAEAGDEDAELSVRERLYTLTPEDDDAGERLCHCLERAGRHQDLLLTLHRRLEHAVDQNKRLALLQAIARVWEALGNNRFACLDAWQRVLALAPSDPEALEALTRASVVSSATWQVAGPRVCP